MIAPIIMTSAPSAAQRKAQPNLARHDGISEDAWKPDAFEEAGRSGRGEYEKLGQSVSQQERATGYSQQGNGS